MDVIITIIRSSLAQAAIFAVLALGVILSFRVVRFPDLTVEGSFLLGAAASAKLLERLDSPWLALVAALACGAGAGFVTALLTEKIRVSRLLAGIIVMTASYSIALRMMGRANVPITRSATLIPAFDRAQHSDLWNIGIMISIALFVFFTIGYLLWTEVGLHLRAVGNNLELMSSLGRRIDFFVTLGLILSNGLIGLSGGLAAQQFGGADISIGSGILVAGLACLFLGDAFVNSRHINRLLAAAIVGTVVYCGLRALARQININAADLKGLSAAMVVIALVITRRKGPELVRRDEFL